CLKKRLKLVCPYTLGLNDMRTQNVRHPCLIDLRTFLETGEIHTGSIPAEYPVRFGSERSFIHDTIVVLRINTLPLTPVLGKDVMDVNALIEIPLDIHGFTGTKIPSAIPQQEGIQALIRGTIAR